MILTTAQKRDALYRASAQRCYRWGGRYYVTIIASRASITNGPMRTFRNSGRPSGSNEIGATGDDTRNRQICGTPRLEYEKITPSDITPMVLFRRYRISRVRGRKTPPVSVRKVGNVGGILQEIWP